MNIGIYVGVICSAPAEVVCNSTNPHLDLIADTGGALRMAGGWCIQQECHAIIARAQGQTGKRFLPPGSAVATTTGALPYRGIVHCVAIDPFHDSSAGIISGCVMEAMRELAAMDLPARSVSTPVRLIPVRLMSSGSPAHQNHTRAALDRLRERGIAARRRQR